MPTLINPSTVSAHERGLWYGDGGFTTLRVVRGELCFWSRHLDRLQELARVLDLQVNWEDLQIALRIVARKMPNGVVKIIISRGEGGRGYLPPEQEAQTLIFHWPDATLQWHPDLPLTLPIEAVSLNRQLGWCSPFLRGLKTLNRLDQVLLRQELDQHQASEGLVFDLEGQLVSGVQSNVFWCRDGQWYTPSLQRAGIAGTLRAELLARAEQQRVRVQIGRLTRTQDTGESGYALQGLFFCNALRGIQPVRRLDGQELPVDAVQRLHDLLSFSRS